MTTVNITEQSKRVIVEEEGLRVVSVGVQGPPGATGDPGPVGASCLNGSADPSPADGQDGDLWINTTSWDVFENTGGSWSVVGNIKGADGTGGGISQVLPGWSGFAISSGSDTAHDLTISSGEHIASDGTRTTCTGGTLQIDSATHQDSGSTVISAGATIHVHLTDAGNLLWSTGKTLADATSVGIIASFVLDGSANLPHLQSRLVSTTRRRTDYLGIQTIYNSGAVSVEPSDTTLSGMCPAGVVTYGNVSVIMSSTSTSIYMICRLSKDSASIGPEWRMRDLLGASANGYLPATETGSYYLDFNGTGSGLRQYIIQCHGYEEQLA